MERNGTMDFAKLLAKQKQTTMTEAVLKLLVNLWLAGGGLAFTTAFIVGKAFWPAVGAYFQSFYYLWKYAHGGAP